MKTTAWSTFLRQQWPTKRRDYATDSTHSNTSRSNRKLYQGDEGMRWWVRDINRCDLACKSDRHQWECNDLWGD